jgi:pyruvate/2-oxoglutarate dehydrogenase complex dihydrolipoamide dehydrogenase (E3) component
MAEDYDLVVIGSGTAAQVAAARVSEADWRVAVIDHRPFGGTCALRGCDPKKMLISGAEAIHAATRMRGHGVTGALATTRRLAEAVYGFKVLLEEGMDLILGAHLVGPHADEVINIFGLAIRHGLTATQLKSTIFAYPTGASDVGYMV